MQTKSLLLLQAAGAAAALAGALIAQYGFLLHPCHLCLLQRYPYAIIIGVVLVSQRLPKKRMAAIICALLFLTDAGIAFYHAGVEAGIFPGPSGCASSNIDDNSIEALRASIMNAPLVSCDQAMAHFFGLSMAAWNAIAAFSLAVGSAIILKKAKA